MKVLFLTNNDNTSKLVEFIQLTDEVEVFSKKVTKEIIVQYEPDFIVSYNYRFIIFKDIIEEMKGKIINLHISLLPWNKGSYPNLWSIIESTPKGVTIHYVSEGVDEGDILLQKKVDLDEDRETLSSSYDKLHTEIQKLFMDNWLELKSGTICAIKQKEGGSKHNSADTTKYLNLIDDWSMPIGYFKKLINNL